MNERHVLNWDKPIERYFEEISRIPRNSECEREISGYVVDFAARRDLEVYQDELCNVIVKKPASADRQGIAPVILEGHMDMVCAKTAESSHDFSRDPVQLCLNDGVLTAKGTTLGADDGFGVAYMLAILDDDSLSHPPLECVFTVQEETNMVGARYLDKSRLEACRMIGLDGDRERETFVGCACSDRIILKRDYVLEEAEGAVTELRLDGFYTGNYQGIVHPECGNVIKIAARLLRGLTDRGISYQICRWRGGEMENKNPFETSVLLVLSEEDTDRAEAALEKDFREILEEFEDQRYRGALTLSFGTQASKGLSREESRRLAAMIHAMPNNLFQAGVLDQEMRVINNIGTVQLADGVCEIVMSARGKQGSRELELVRCCEDVAAIADFDVIVEERYRSWPYNRDSKLRALANRIAEEDYGFNFREETCPGGLEVAYFFEGKEDFDALQLGPDLEGLHTPDEKMDMASFHRVYDLVCRMLSEMA